MCVRCLRQLAATRGRAPREPARRTVTVAFAVAITRRSGEVPPEAPAVAGPNDHIRALRRAAALTRCSGQTRAPLGRAPGPTRPPCQQGAILGGPAARPAAASAWMWCPGRLPGPHRAEQITASPRPAFLPPPPAPCPASGVPTWSLSSESSGLVPVPDLPPSRPTPGPGLSQVSKWQPYTGHSHRAVKEPAPWRRPRPSRAGAGRAATPRRRLASLEPGPRGFVRPCHGP